MWRLRKGIGLETNPGEQYCCTIVVVGALSIVQALISEVTMTRAVTARKKRKTTSKNLAVPFSSKRVSVR